MTKKQLLQKWVEITKNFSTNFNKTYRTKKTFGDSDIAIDEDFIFAFINHVVYHRG
ncbi:MAG: hypothetical protein U9O98_02005 [Asgard group archaeon]|nr:hypothetical protein [Asgard group archaeon]